LNGVEDNILAATNQFRAQEKRPELKGNSELTKAARYFAEFMARTDKYSHTADDKEPWQRAEKFGYLYCIVAENIAYQYSSAGFSTAALAQGFMEGWKQSPEHRKNMLDPDLTEIGVAVAHSAATGRYYAVQDFGRPKSAAISFRLANQTDAVIRYSFDGKDYSLEPRYTRTHETCRPAELHLQGTTEKEVLHPRTGDRFLVRQDDSGKLHVEKRSK
jgi:hypothetical protein